MNITNLKYLIISLFFINPLLAMHDEAYPTKSLEVYQLTQFNNEIYIDVYSNYKSEVFSILNYAFMKIYNVIAELRSIKEFENVIIKFPYYLDALLIKVSDINHLNEDYGWYGFNREFYKLNKKHSAKMEKLNNNCVKLIFNEPKEIYELQKEYKKALENHKDVNVELVETNFEYDENNISYIDSLNTHDVFGNCGKTWIFHVVSKDSKSYKRYRLEYSLYENIFTKCVDEDAESMKKFRADVASRRYHSSDCAHCNRYL